MTQDCGKHVLLYTSEATVRQDELPELIALKIRRKWSRELADVVRLIEAFKLDETFLPLLPSDLRPQFTECLEELRRDDAFNSL